MTPQYIIDLAKAAQVEFDNCRNYNSEIDIERRRALAYYMQVPFGSELAVIPGSSQFITSDVRDTVDWGLAQLMDMFYSGDAPVRFDPRNEGDVDQADIETEYVNDVIQNQNEGFEVIYTWFKDALIQKNGVVKVWWDSTIDEVPEEYDSLTFGEYAQLLADKEFLVKKVTFMEEKYTPEELAPVIEQMGPEEIFQARFAVKGVRANDIRQVRIKNIAPENFVVSRSQLSLNLENCSYCGDVEYLTRAELIADGHPVDVVMSLPVASIAAGDDQGDASVRYQKESDKLQTVDAATRAGEIVEITNHYVVDMRGSEPKRYCIKTSSNGSVILDHYEVDKVPYFVVTPKLNPYRWFGDSLADEVVDIQFANSNLMRSVFENVKYSVNCRKFVKGQVDLEALQDYRPTVVIELGPDGEVTNEVTPFVADKALEIKGVLENMRAERTGFSRDTMGLNPEALAKTTNFVGATIMSLSQTRMKLIAMSFAHTGYKLLCEYIRELLLKHEDRDKVFAMTGKYITVSPRSWHKSRSTSVKVGLGYAGRLEQVQAMQSVLDLQEKLVTAQGGVQGPMVSADNIYNAISRMAEVSGIKDYSAYFMDPKGYEPPPPQPTTEDIKAQAYADDVKNKKEVEMAKLVAQTKTDASKMKMEYDFKYKQLSDETAVKLDELILKYQGRLSDDLNERRAAQISRAAQEQSPSMGDNGDDNE